ncbi:uncharacterized protein [Dermacentor andersoni]|uniref:uncharacterized protein isoform X1 n=1 Tax=Dermacentor andersoni TaxID=34620 RepID=UPI002155B41A|nr:uncharacterized protein LOC126527291 isoform X1 [Dermacentor andersoni]
MALLGPVSLQFILISVSGIVDTARLFAAEYGTAVRLPCDENVEAPDEVSALSAFDAVWTDPRGVTLVGGGGDDDQGSSAAELRGDPWVDAFSGDLSLAAVDFDDAGDYSCSGRYADGEALTEPRESKHILQVYETPVAGQCECGCELIGNVCLACSPGQYGKSGVCHLCSVGSFNERHGAVCCQRCPFLYVTWGRGATSRQGCSGVLRDFLIGLAVLACLSINLYALFKFSGPIVLDSLCEYVFKEANASKLWPDADDSDDASDDGMPEDVFDGISRFITRLKKRKLPKALGEDVPLLPASEPAGDPEHSDDDDQLVVCYNHDASPDAADDVPRIVPVRPLRHPKFPSVIGSGAASGEDVFTGPEHSISEQDSTSPERAASGSLSDVALVGSPEQDWISSGRRRWIGRYDVTVAGTPNCEGRLHMATALADGLSERSGGNSSLPEQRATYDVFVGRWSSTETADAASNVSFLSNDSRSCPTGANAYGTSQRECSSSEQLEDPQFHWGPPRPPLTATTLAEANSSSDGANSLAAPWKFRSGHCETKSAQKTASYVDVKPTSEKIHYPSARGDKKLASEETRHEETDKRGRAVTSKLTLSPDSSGRDRAAVVWIDDVSSENGESEGTSARTRDRAVSSTANRTRAVQGLRHSDGEQTCITETGESGYLLSSVAGSSSETTGITIRGEVEFKEPGSRKATRATKEANALSRQKLFRNDPDA